MSLIMERYEDIYIFTTFFFTKISTSGYHGIQSWTSRVELFNKRVLLFPIHLTNHWCLVAVHMTTSKIILHDSLRNSNSAHCMDVVEQYLVVEAAERKVTLGSFSKEICTTPKQDNFNDCGVFVCMNGRNISEKSALKFYVNIPKTRLHIKNELLCSKLLHFTV